jgi:UPF0755 protein
MARDFLRSTRRYFLTKLFACAIVKKDFFNMKKTLSIILRIIIIFLLLVLGAFLFVWQQIKTPVGESDAIQTVAIEKGEGIKKIASDLEQAGIIRGKFYFEIYVLLKDARNLQAGEYELSPSMAMPEIVEILLGGKVNSNEVRITIPEGFNLKEIDARLAANGLIKAGDLINYKPTISDSPLAISNLEGYLFPDTYIFSKDATLDDIVGKILDNFNAKVDQQMLDEIKNQNETLEQVLTMASIVQQEAGSRDEMPEIAGVFSNRLAIGMALQSDATVNYITDKGMRQPLLTDTEIDSPYNTYEYKGLPPGPICNPGLDAIEAAIHPEKNDYLYFLHPLNAPTVFSKTLDEHNANKAKWLK